MLWSCFDVVVVDDGVVLLCCCVVVVVVVVAFVDASKLKRKSLFCNIIIVKCSTFDLTKIQVMKSLFSNAGVIPIKEM